MKPGFVYVGNKHALSSWIIEKFPQHKCYVEVFGGSAAVLLNKPKAPVEIYNDIDQGLVNFYSVIRDKAKCEELIDLLDYTPYSRAEHDVMRKEKRKLHEWGDVQWARAFYCLTMQSYNAKFANTWSTTPSKKQSKTINFRSYRDRFKPICERLEEVSVECRSFEYVIPRYDTRDTLTFLDPPYVLSTRTNTYYHHDAMKDEDHVKMLELAKACVGKVVICGYHSQLYDDHLKNWNRDEKVIMNTMRPKNGKPTEVLWMNF